MSGESSLCGRRKLIAVWIRLVLFIVPLIVVVCLPVYLIDPYGLFARHGSAGDTVKHEIAVGVNHVLLGIVSFSKQPVPNILLGDSQMNRFKVEEIEAITHQRYSNLSYGGGTLAESIATFWYATHLVKLKKVYFGMSFYSFTDNVRNRVDSAVNVVNHPVTYFSNGDVLEATWGVMSSDLFHHSVRYQPTLAAGDFWRQQLGELVRRGQTYSASQRTLAEIRAIVEYCRVNDIEIEFIIPPEHQDVRTRIQALGMYDRYLAFKSTVFDLGPTYDCDIASDFTQDAANFQDPYHTTVRVGSLLTKSIWSGEREWCDVRRAR